MMAIKHCVHRQKNSSENSMGEESQQRQFWLSQFTLAENNKSEANTARKKVLLIRLIFIL
jgi:hypothetical protein